MPTVPPPLDTSEVTRDGRRPVATPERQIGTWLIVALVVVVGLVLVTMSYDRSDVTPATAPVAPEASIGTESETAVTPSAEPVVDPTVDVNADPAANRTADPAPDAATPTPPAATTP